VKGCPFCAVVSGGEAHLLLESPEVLALLDHAPLIPGHSLVLPRRHVETLDELPSDLLAPLFAAVQRLSAALQRGLGADGSFAAINTRVSQSVPHLHVHVVPRHRGDGLFRAGMVWQRRRYREGEAEELAKRIRSALET
jgi:histidine triad (HIT) family protein